MGEDHQVTGREIPGEAKVGKGRAQGGGELGDGARAHSSVLGCWGH